jgi:Spy/CpxP family protein refolding chaperone
MGETPSAKAADGQNTRVVKKIRAKGRLPNYYAEVVTEKQREEIYKIQEEYKAKIDAAKAQLETLTKERNDKISTILTAEQKKKIDEAAAKTKKAKEDKTTDSTPKTTDSTPKTTEKTEKKTEK